MKIAIAGLGVVGGGVVKTLAANAAEIFARSGNNFEIIAVSAKNKNKMRGFDCSKFQFFSNPLDLVNTNAEIIIEVMGGAEGDALELARKSLAAKKHFITANKAMLAHHGGELAELAEKNNVQLCYEAAVAGGIPVIKALREGLAANKIKQIMGILNGTSNYILTNMAQRSLEFPEILKEAQAKGYAEADPSFDVGGIDAAHKLTLLAANAFAGKPNFADMYIEGIDAISVKDISYAAKLGYVIKHICFAHDNGSSIQQRVHPCLVPNSHPLASVNDVFNAVEFESSPVGATVLIGRGAGEGPTASAIIADLVDIAQKRSPHAFNVKCSDLKKLNIQKINDTESSYYLRLVVADKPGVLEEITNILKKVNISVKKLLQEDEDKNAEVIIITHNAKHADIAKVVAKFAGLENIVEPTRMIRVL